MSCCSFFCRHLWLSFISILLCVPPHLGRLLKAGIDDKQHMDVRDRALFSYRLLMHDVQEVRGRGREREVRKNRQTQTEAAESPVAKPEDCFPEIVVSS